MAASEALPYVKSIFYGLRDSFLGIIAFFKPIYQKSEVKGEDVVNAESEEFSRTRRRPKQTTRKTQRYRYINTYTVLKPYFPSYFLERT